MQRSGLIRIVFCVLLSICTFSLCHSRPLDDEIERVEKNLLPYNPIAGELPYTIAERMAHYNVPGVSIAVIEDFEVRWTASYGVAGVETAVPVNEATVFCVGSVSKAVTAAGTLTLVADGLIDLDGDVNTQLSGWRIPDNEFTRQAPVTPRGLLNHSGGVVFSPGPSYAADQFPTLLQVLTGEDPALTNPVMVDVVPGTRFQYSNGGFSVMRKLIEEKSEQSFAECIRSRVFAPLGMTHSTFDIPISPDYGSDVAAGHGRDGNCFPGPTKWIGHVAAGGLYTTAADYAAFVIELQKSLQGRSNRVLSQDLVEQMLSPQVAANYGLGVFLREHQGEPHFSHIGDARGFVAGFTAHRSNGYGAVILTNGQNGINLTREIFRSIGAVYDWQGYQIEPRRALALSGDALDNLAGRYRIGCDEVVTIVRDGDPLRIEASGFPGFRLYPVAPDTLICRERDGEIVVVAGTNAAVGRLYIGLSDEIGRLPENPRVAMEMTEGERTPLEMLLAGDIDTAFARYSTLRVTDPANPETTERRFNILGYRFLQGGRVSDAVAVFRLNTRLYPESANCHDSLGEGLAAMGDTVQAVTSYRMSLKLNPQNTNAVEKLQLLTGE